MIALYLRTEDTKISPLCLIGLNKVYYKKTSLKASFIRLICWAADC